MKIEFTSLAIQAFRSFEKDEVFHFPLRSGFYFLTGENKVEPELGPNGSGKSSIWDALCWVLYGVTARGVKASGVGNWKAEHLTTVLLEFKRDGKLYNVMRAWNPNALSLTEHGKEARAVTQEELDEFIGIDCKGFLNVVLMSQFGQFFFDLGSTEKLAVFSEALSLDYWVKRSDDAKKVVKTNEAAKHRLEETAATLSGRGRALVERRDSANRRRDEFDKDRSSRLLVLQNGIQQAESIYEELRKKLDTESRSLSGFTSQAGEEEKELIVASGKHRDAEKIYSACQVELRYAYQAFEKDQKELEKAQSESTCLRCGQPVDKSEQIKSVKQNISLRTTELQGYEKAVKLAKVEVDNWLGKVGVINEGMRQAAAKTQSVLDVVSRLQSKVRTSQHNLQILVSEREKLEASTNPWIAELEETSIQLRANRNSQLKITDQVTDVEEIIVDTSYWVTAFKDLRLWLIEEAVLELEVEVNNSLMALGLVEWKVNFDIERDNVSGGVTKGFDALITSPSNDKRVPWKAWSGGETQRLRIAGAIGLMNLISARTGVFFNVEIWDEPTAHINDAGIEQLLMFFETRSRSTNKQVWIVDHRSHAYGGFDGTIRVVKDNTGSHVVQPKGRDDRLM